MVLLAGILQRFQIYFNFYLYLLLVRGWKFALIVSVSGNCLFCTIKLLLKKAVVSKDGYSLCVNR